MHPVLIDIGIWRVTSYGLALTLGFAFGIGLGLARARKYGMATEPILGVSLVIVVSSIAGSRLFVLATEPAATSAGWLAAINPFANAAGLAGLSVMGGLPAALICAYAYLRLRGLPVVTYMDGLAPSVAFGAAFARVGCFFNGCCYGVVCEWPWAVRFPPGSFAHEVFGPAAVHPTQLYQAALGLALGLGLLALARTRPAEGTVIAGLLFGMGAQRIIVEAVRHQASSEVWFQLPNGAVVSIYQGVAAALCVAGALVWKTVARRAEPA